MHLSTVALIALAVMFTVFGILLAAVFMAPRSRQFYTDFIDAFGFLPPRPDRLDRFEKRVMAKVEKVGLELAEAQAIVQRQVDFPSGPSADGLSQLSSAYVAKKFSVTVERKQAEYGNLRRLARKAGYSGKLFEEIHQRTLEEAGDPRAVLAPY